MKNNKEITDEDFIDYLNRVRSDNKRFIDDWSSEENVSKRITETAFKQALNYFTESANRYLMSKTFPTLGFNVDKYFIDDAKRNKKNLDEILKTKFKISKEKESNIGYLKVSEEFGVINYSIEKQHLEEFIKLCKQNYENIDEHSK